MYFGLLDTRLDMALSPFRCSQIAYIGHNLVLYTTLPAFLWVPSFCFQYWYQKVVGAIPVLFVHVPVFQCRVQSHFMWVFDPALWHEKTCIAVCLLLILLLPSGKQPHNYGQIHHFLCVNQLFLWPCSSSLFVCLPEGYPNWNLMICPVGAGKSGLSPRWGFQKVMGVPQLSFIF